jgi:hypothetical protein
VRQNSRCPVIEAGRFLHLNVKRPRGQACGRCTGLASVNHTRRTAVLNLARLIGLTLAGETLAGAPKLRKLRVRIDAGNATVTLAEFVRQTGLQVLFEADVIREHSTQAVSGQLDAAEALARMLDGSGLIFEFINERTIAVRLQKLRQPGNRASIPAKTTIPRPL